MIVGVLLVFSLMVTAIILNVDRQIRQRGQVVGPVEHWLVRIHGSGNREHTIEHNGIRSFQYFCVNDHPDPFYEGMTVDLYFQRYEKCWEIVNYNILRSDDNGTVQIN